MERPISQHLFVIAADIAIEPGGDARLNPRIGDLIVLCLHDFIGTGVAGLWDAVVEKFRQSCWEIVGEPVEGAAPEWCIEMEARAFNVIRRHFQLPAKEAHVPGCEHNPAWRTVNDYL